MKRPVLFLSALFICIILSTVVVSTTVSGLLRSFYKSDMDMNAKTAPAENQSKDLVKFTNAKL